MKQNFLKKYMGIKKKISEWWRIFWLWNPEAIKGENDKLNCIKKKSGMEKKL